MEQLQSSPAFDALRHRRSATIDKTMPSAEFTRFLVFPIFSPILPFLLP
jgi:hypothetical protein